MENLLFTLLGFVCGWGCDKVLDYVFNHTTRNYKIRRLRKKISRQRTAENSLTPHISILGTGIPAFDPTSHLQVKLSNEEFFLSASVHLETQFPATFKLNTEEDKWLKGLDARSIGVFFQIDDFRDVLEESKREVTNSFSNRTDGCYFNNKLYGLISADCFGRTPDEKEAPVLSFKFFTTDYYTHRVMWNVTQKLRERHLLPSELLTTEHLNGFYHCFRTSLGISIVIKIPDMNEIIMTRRAKSSAYSEGKEWIYVSVTETISETDYDNFMGNLNVVRWIKRALFEELGLQEKHYKEETIQLYDMFFENFFYQDGLTASIELRNNITIEDVKKLKARDKMMEVKEIFTIADTKENINRFIETNRQDLREQTIFALHSYMERKD